MPATPRILVLYDQGSAGPIQIAHSLADVGEVVLGVPSGDQAARLEPYLDGVCDHIVLDRDPGAAVAAAVATKPDAVVTFAEPMVSLTATVADALGLPGHARPTAELLTDKARQRARLRAAGVDDTRSVLLTEPGDWPDAARQVGLPAVLKPVNGQGSRNTHRVDDLAAGAAVVARLLDPADAAEPALVAETFLCGADRTPFGDFVSVESVVAHGAITHLAVTGKYPLLPPFREQGQYWPAAVPDAELAPVLDLVTLALKALDVRTGVLHTEVKLTAAGPRLIEVNGRMGGFMNDLSTRGTGFDLIEAAALVALGERVEVDFACPGDVVFGFNNLAPVEEVRFGGVTGAAAVRALSGVDEYTVLAVEGGIVGGGVATQELDMVCGRASDHAGMLRLIDEACGLLEFTFSRGAVTHRVPASRLSSPGGAFDA